MNTVQAADQAIADLETTRRDAIKLIADIRTMAAAIPTSDDPAELRAAALGMARASIRNLQACVTIADNSLSIARASRQTSKLAAEMQQRLAVEQAVRSTIN